MAGKRYQFTLPEPLSKKLEKVSAEKGMSKSILLALALEQYLKNLNGQEEKRDKK